MNKLKIWLIPIFIVVLVLIALFYVRGRLPEKPTPTTVQTEVEVTPSTTKPKGFASAPEPSDQEKAEMDTEAIVAALNANDISACEEITWNTELKQRCLDDLNYAAALQSNNAAICGQLHNDDLKSQCYNKVYMSMAVDQGDTALCEKITDENLKALCLDQVSMILAHNAADISGCATITSESLRKQCEDNYYYKGSIRELNEAGCNSISDPILAKQCRSTVSKNIEVKKQSELSAQNTAVIKSSEEMLDLCSNLSSKKALLCQDAIYPQLAFDNKDLSYCEKISDPKKADECKSEQGQRINAYYLRQAVAQQDKDLCNKILDDDLKQVCQSS